MSEKKKIQNKATTKSANKKVQKEVEEQKYNGYIIIDDFRHKVSEKKARKLVKEGKAKFA